MQAGTFGALYGATAVLVASYYAFGLAVLVLQYVALWRIFVKAGEPGWKSLIPIYNGHVMFKLFWKPIYYWLTIILAPVVVTLVLVWAGIATATGTVPAAFSVIAWGIYLIYIVLAIVWGIKLYVKMARSFGQGGAFAAGLIFLPTIFMMILAFGKYSYLGNPADPAPQPEQPEQPKEPWE